jgi:hypothetical protein
MFEISDEESNREITTPLIQYLMLCFTSRILRDRFSKAEEWSLKDFRAYAEYLNEWTLIEYALRYIAEDRDRWDQDNSVPELVATLVRRLTNHQASHCFGNFIAFCVGPNHGKIIPFNEQQTASENIQYNTLNAAAELKLSQVANAFLLTCTQDDPHAERKMPLMISVQKGLPEATRLILGLNVDKDAQDNSGRTALHYAVEREDEVIVKLLVEQGAESRIPDRSNVTALKLSLKKLYVCSSPSAYCHSHGINS